MFPLCSWYKKKWLSSTTCHFENIWRKSKSCGHAHLLSWKKNCAVRHSDWQLMELCQSEPKSVSPNFFFMSIQKCLYLTLTLFNNNFSVIYNSNMCVCVNIMCMNTSECHCCIFRASNTHVLVTRTLLWTDILFTTNTACHSLAIVVS